MKPLLILIATLLLCACSEVEVKITDPDSNDLIVATYKGPRKVTLEVPGIKVAVGEVAINNETVKVLVKEAAPIVVGAAPGAVYEQDF